MSVLTETDAQQTRTPKRNMSERRISSKNPSTQQIGKPTGIDIKEQKMTLPLIHVLNQCSKKEKSWLINSIKNHNKDSKRVKEVITFVKQNGGLDYAVLKMKSFQQEALELLEPYPESIYKKSLILMVNYVIERNK